MRLPAGRLQINIFNQQALKFYMKIIKNKFFILGFILLIGVAALYFIFGKKPVIEYTTAKVYQGSLIRPCRNLAPR